MVIEKYYLNASTCKFILHPPFWVELINESKRLENVGTDAIALNN